MRIFRQITANNVTIKEYPFLKELAMEAYLLENEDILVLDDNNFSNVEVLDAEIALKAGSKRDKGGRVDILAKYGGEFLGIFELKKEVISDSTLIQLERYLDEKEQILKIAEYWDEETSPKWIGVLVGESIEPSLQEKLQKGYDYNGIPIAGMTIRRFRSDQNEIFVISDTYFSFKYSSKDYSKFIFQNKEFNKGRLVNKIVKTYVELNPDTTYSKLKQVFPDNIQGSKRFGVFTLKDEAEDIYNRWGHKRHYIKPEELISLKDEIISTCTQWNTFNISKFIEHSKKLGLHIEIK